MIPAALLALADQRLPSGGHVHSGGIEQAIRSGLVGDSRSLGDLLIRRVRTVGLVAAALAAAAWSTDASNLPALDAEADARTPSQPAREASRAQGRGLLRTARTAWVAPHAGLSWSDFGARPHHALVLGASARAAGVDVAGAALVAAYLCVTGPATAAQRLLAMDPIQVAALTVSLGPDIEAVAAAATASFATYTDLPGASDPLLDLFAAAHHQRTDCLFAS